MYHSTHKNNPNIRRIFDLNTNVGPGAKVDEIFAKRIDDNNIDFNPGLTVITGETGSGKSIILEAISSLIMGM